VANVKCTHDRDAVCGNCWPGAKVAAENQRRRKEARRQKALAKWRKRMEPKKSTGVRAIAHARRVVGNIKRLVPVHWKYIPVGVLFDVERMIEQAILLEHARGVHEGASNPYC